MKLCLTNLLIGTADTTTALQRLWARNEAWVRHKRGVSQLEHVGGLPILNVPLDVSARWLSNHGQLRHNAASVSRLFVR